MSGSEYCYTHDPDLEEERAESRRRGGLALHYGAAGKPNTESVRIRTTDDVLALLEQAGEDAMSKKPSTERARVLTAIATAALRAVEQHDLVARIEALEDRLKPRAVQ